MSINKTPRSKLLREIILDSPYTQKHPPHPNAGVQGGVKLITQRLRRPLRCTLQSIPGKPMGLHSEMWEGFLFLAAGGRSHFSAPALPSQGHPPRSGKPTASRSELPFLALQFLSLASRLLLSAS